jgi:predicted permease
MAMYPVVGPYAEWFEVRGTSLFRAIGRLHPGAHPKQTEDDLMRFSRELEAEFPKEAEGLGIRLRPLRDSIFLPRDQDRYGGYARTLISAAGLILMICCINVAHLLLVRGLMRRRELAIRQTLGAGRRRVMTQLLVENLTLFLFGGLLALPVAHFALDFLWKLRPPQIPAEALDLSPDVQVFGIALAATLGLGLVFGTLPAWRAARVDIVPQLKETPPSAAGGRQRLTPQRFLVIAQVALALVALIGAGLFFRSLAQSYRIDLGFDVSSLVVMSIAPGEEGYSEEQTRNLYDRFLEHVEALPGVQTATLSENRLLRGAVWQRQIFIEGQTEAITIGTRAMHRTNVVVPGFFDSVGIPIEQGRDFSTGDRADTRAVAIINKTFAEEAWPGQDPIGHRFHYDYVDGPLLEVIGVAQDARYRHVREDSQFFVYMPLAQEFRGSVSLHVKSAGDPTLILGPVRKKLRELAPELPISQMGPLTDFVHEDLWLDHVAVRFLGLFGGLALVLAIIGVYGVLAQQMNLRRREIGIRLSLGAQRGVLERQLMGETLTLVGGGLALGLVLAFLMLRFATSLTEQLHGASLVDPLTWGLAVLVLLVAGCVGGWLPSRRAVRTDPAVVLRQD